MGWQSGLALLVGVMTVSGAHKTAKDTCEPKEEWTRVELNDRTGRCLVRRIRHPCMVAHVCCELGLSRGCAKEKVHEFRPTLGSPLAKGGKTPKRNGCGGGREGLANALPLREAARVAPPMAAGGWLRSKGGGFSAWLPGQPSRRSKSVPSEFGRIPFTLYSLRHEGAAYELSHFELPPGTTLDLDAAMHEYVARRSAHLLEQWAIEHPDGHWGREALCSVPGGAHRWMRIYLVGNRQYMMAVEQPAGAPASEDVERFFDSLTFVEG